MKGILLGAAVAAIAAFGCGTAFAADGTAYLAQCKANTQSMPAGGPVTAAMVMDFCQCIVDSGDQSVIDEAAAMKPGQPPASQPSQKFMTTASACSKKAGFPQRPPGGGQ